MIEIKNIQKRYGRKKVLDGVSFTANKSDNKCRNGKKGSGKTTIINEIMALTPIKSGEILVNGKKVNKHRYEEVAYIPDAITMLPQMKILEAMEFMNDYYRNWNNERAKEILDFFNLNENDRISSLSKGNTAKVNLILGLAMDADFLMMDEPFSGIDIFSREQIADVFTSHLIEDRGVIMTTHEINDIEHLIDKVVFINEGVVLKEFDAEEVREREGKSVVDVMREVYNA